MASSAAEATRRAAGHTAKAVQSVLEDPRLRERIPGRSLPLLGAGLVTLAILLSWLPGFWGIGFWWSLVMLAGSALVAAQELHAAGRPVPGSTGIVERVAESKLVLPAFTVLTTVHAILMLRLGIIPILWLLAAVVLGYDQRRALRRLVEEQSTPSAVDRHLARWVLAGALVCTVSLFFTWGASGGYFLGGFQPYQVRDMKMDGFTRQYETRTEWGYTPMMNYVPAYSASGRGRPFAAGALLVLGGLVALTRGRKVRATLPPWVLPVLAGTATLWGLVGLASHLGPWLFLGGTILIHVAVARDFMKHQRAS